MMLHIPKPQEGEYAPYTIDYIKLVPDDGRVLTHLLNNFLALRQYVESLSSDILTTSHKAGEWTIHEILVHVIDTERVFGYRALRIARGDTTPLPGFEQDDYVPTSGANDRSLDDILDEYHAVRRATVALFHTFDERVLTNTTLTSQNLTSVRALIYIAAGHELHHLESIKENYG